MNPKSQNIHPMLQREISAHHPSTSISAILRILERAEMGDLVAQAELFHDMEERDAHIYAEMTKRKMAVAQLDCEFRAPRDAGAREKKDIKALEERLEDAIDIETMVFNMADAIGHGFSALEISWQRDGSGFWMPSEVKPRPQRWFTVDIATRQQLRLRDTSAEGVELIKYGWIIHEHSSKTGSIATQGLYRALALPYLFKNFATKNWLRFCELYAVPIRILFHNEKDETKKNLLMAELQAIGQSGVALLEGGMQEDLKTESLTTGEGIGFQSLIEWCERSVSKAILGGTLTSSTGNNGNYATAQVHDDVRYQIRDHDAKQIAATLTKQLLGAIVAVNGLSIRPSWCFDTQEPEDLALYADAIPKLVAVGAKIPLSYLHEKLKIPVPEKDEEILSAPQQKTIPQDQAQSANAALSGEAIDIDKSPVSSQADLLSKVSEKSIKTWVDTIRAKVESADSLEALRDDLLHSYGDLDSKELTKVMTLAFAAADMSGRYDVKINAL